MPDTSPTTDDDSALRARVDAVDWSAVGAALDARGWAVIAGLIDADRCRALRALYDRDLFRKVIGMERHGYGRGEYKYFGYPLPAAVATLRESLYPWLSPIANRWHAELGIDTRFPQRHDDFIRRCHAAGQARPTPLLLRYGAGDYNRLHQDLYGDQVFPLQVAVLLSDPRRDFTGGEVVLTEQRPRMQSRPMVVPLTLGDAAIFAVSQRPETGPRGPRRVQMRHGVSEIRSGARMTLGIIFHDAK